MYKLKPEGDLHANPCKSTRVFIQIMDAERRDSKTINFDRVEAFLFRTILFRNISGISKSSEMAFHPSSPFFQTPAALLHNVRYHAAIAS
jgi:hypothetical protein